MTLPVVTFTDWRDYELAGAELAKAASVLGRELGRPIRFAELCQLAAGLAMIAAAEAAELLERKPPQAEQLTTPDGCTCAWAPADCCERHHVEPTACDLLAAGLEVCEADGCERQATLWLEGAGDPAYCAEHAPAGAVALELCRRCADPATVFLEDGAAYCPRHAPAAVLALELVGPCDRGCPTGEDYCAAHGCELAGLGTGLSAYELRDRLEHRRGFARRFLGPWLG